MKTKVLTQLIALAAVTTVGFGCAHKQAEQELKEKVSQETAVTSTQDLRVEATSALEKADLTVAQREQLKTLQENTRKQLDTYHNESLRLRSILIKDLVAKTNKAEEIALIKKQLRQVENKRLSVLFDAVEKANLITGHNNPVNERLMNDFFDIHDRNL